MLVVAQILVGIDIRDGIAHNMNMQKGTIPPLHRFWIIVVFLLSATNVMSIDMLSKIVHNLFC